MATILRGKKKGQTVKISQFCNDWVSTTDGQILALGSLKYTVLEFSQIINSKNVGMMWAIYKPDIMTQTFKRIKR